METPKSCLVQGQEDAGLFKALVTKKNLPLFLPSLSQSVQISFLATPLWAPLFSGAGRNEAHEPVLSTSSLCYVGATSAWWFVDMADQKHLLVSSFIWSLE